jgi:hypothetical protein
VEEIRRFEFGLCVTRDSVDYRDDFPKYSVVQQILTRCKVKEGRKVYIKINSSGFSSVPDLIEKTYREAVPTLKSIRTRRRYTLYIPNLGKTWFLTCATRKKHQSGRKSLEIV